jgi:lipoic acid synthetase
MNSIDQNNTGETERKIKPEWLRIRVRTGDQLAKVSDLVKKLRLHTVCEEANCPNRMECFERKTATFMILGNQCTRQCTFCNVMKGIPEIVDFDEPAHVAEGVKVLGLSHAVITSVTRDDLQDGGAFQFASVIQEIRKTSPGTTIEVLIPDFQGDYEALEKVLVQLPDVLNHNIETVPRLYPVIRPKADYQRSLDLLKRSSDYDSRIITKSGIMLGLGENKDEVMTTLSDLRKHGCRFLTIGQYLPPSKNHYPLKEYIHPRQFEDYKEAAEKMGFEHVASAPLVRSSYHAGEALNFQETE